MSRPLSSHRKVRRMLFSDLSDWVDVVGMCTDTLSYILYTICFQKQIHHPQISGHRSNNIAFIYSPSSHAFEGQLVHV